MKIREGIIISKKGKTTDGLMRHIRDNHHISISGSKDKNDLLNMGYFHGYKAYKFIKTEQNQLSIHRFSEIKAIYDFDNNMKSVFYPLVMQFETSLKNYTIASIVSNDNTDINYILKKYLNREEEVTGRKDKSKAIKQKLKLKMKLNSSIFYNYGKSEMLKHYFNHFESVPLWALFEHISLGEFGLFLRCLNSKTRIEIEHRIKIDDIHEDTDGTFLADYVFTIKELRNSIAHNNIIFDCRFKNYSVSKSIKKFLESRVGIDDIDFNYIVDYLILLIFYYKHLGESVSNLKKFINSFEEETELLYNNVNLSTYQAIVGSDNKRKIKKLYEYVRR